MWKANVTVSESPDPNTLLASGPTTLTTDDDTGLKQVSVTLQYEDGVPAHLTVGSVVEVSGTC